MSGRERKAKERERTAAKPIAHTAAHDRQPHNALCEDVAYSVDAVQCRVAGTGGRVVVAV